MKPLAVDLCCGLGGWSHGLLAEGWNVVGFDIEQHVYGEDRYPAQLVLQDIRTIDGRQFRGKVQLIVASPPCQKYSYMAMPWTRAKALAAWYRDSAHPERIAELNALFDACVRIGREAECPIVIENVRGAQPWVGRSRWNYGSYHLFGDVPALMPIVTKRRMKFQCHCGPRTYSDREYHRLGDGVKQHKSGRAWFADPDSISGRTSSKINARKATAAMIAKIPFELARYIARVWKPKLAVIAIAVMLFANQVQAVSDAAFLYALAQIESGNRDGAVGSAGELSRFQITKLAWGEVTTKPFKLAANRYEAEPVALKIRALNRRRFLAVLKREPLPWEEYAVWNGGLRGFQRGVPTWRRKRAEWFENLVEEWE